MKDADVVAIAGVLARLAPWNVATGVRMLADSDVALLHASERCTIGNAVVKRRREFASGRALLRELLGVTDHIPVGPNRAPVLPGGVTGTLAHDHAVAVAAISRDPSIRSLGIDVEPTDTLSEAVGRLVLRDDERGIDAHLAFTLKEAAYKAWSNSGGPMLDHHDVRLTVERTRFSAEVIGSGVVLHGRHATVAGRHLALVVEGTDLDHLLWSS